MFTEQQLSERLRSHLQSELRVLNPPEDLLARLRARALDEPAQREPVKAGFRRRWPRLRSAGTVGVSAALALGVGALAVVLIGHRAAPGPGGASVGHAAPAGGPWTSYGQLRASFAVLRRAQTAADRGWQPPRPRPIGPASPVPVPGSSRLATTLSDGSQIFMAVARFHTFPVTAGRFTYSLVVGLVRDHRTLGSMFCDLDAECRSGPFPLGAARPSTVWLSVVPDRVARVRWVFPRQNVYRTETYPGVFALNVLPSGNVAAAPVPRDSSFQPALVAWYGADGSVISRWRHGSPNQVLRLLVPVMSSAPVRALLSGDGIGTLKFGTPVAEVRAALERIYGPPDVSYVTAGTCGADHNMGWALLDLLFRSGRFVGYMYGNAVALSNMDADSPLLATTTRLRLGDSIESVARRYGAAFTIDRAHGWWRLSTPAGRLEGTIIRTRRPFGSDRPGLAIANIDAGVPGCTPNDP
jgi:hypothetical protein